MLPHLRTLIDVDARHTMPPAAMLLMLLLCTDLTFILVHLVTVETGWLRGAGVSLEAERGLPETFQYIKEFWAAVGMGFMFWRTRVGAYAAWSAMFVFLLVDDAGQIHERMGDWLGERYALPSVLGLRPDDAGELLFAVMMGTVAVVLFAFARWRGGEQTRRTSHDVLCLLGLLAVPGVFLDMVHVVAYLQGSLLAQVFLVVEDGGEMVVMSALTAYVFYLASRGGRTRGTLWQNVKALARRSQPGLALAPSRSAWHLQSRRATVSTSGSRPARAVAVAARRRSAPARDAG